LLLVAEHLAAGRLVELVPKRPVDVALHWQATRLALPQVQRLTEAVMQVAARQLLPAGRQAAA
jgi:LysR family transcriptional regulator, chromosome initiation inhibitor